MTGMGALRPAGAMLLGLALALGSAPVRADVTAEALLKVLVRKGVLTEDEAREIRAEAEREAASPTVEAPPDAGVTTPLTPVEPPTPAVGGVAALEAAQAETARQVAALTAASEKAARTSVSGYIQARAVSQRRGSPENNLFVRRARLTVRHTTAQGQFRMTLDGGQNDVTIKDAFLTYNAIPARRAAGPLTLQLGQFVRPFGLELERSSSQREFPERPAGWNVLFPGVWDQGASAVFAPTRDTAMTLALLNGPGAGSASLPFRDPDNFKDVLARVRHIIRAGDAPKAELSLSGYLGRQRVAGTAAVPAQTGFVDENGNGAQDPGEPTVVLSPGRAAVPAVTGDRNRFGLGAWVYDVAGGVARAEYIRARDLTANRGDGPRLVTAPAEAWFLLYTHPVGGGVTVGTRYDVFDPDTRDRNRPGGDGEVRTLGFVALKDFTDNIRLTLAYERPRTTRYDPDTGTADTLSDDVLTFQGQYRF